MNYFHPYDQVVLPAEPTDALPGSPTKVGILARRHATRKQLWHPLDALRKLDTLRPFVGDDYNGQRRCEGRRGLLSGNTVHVF